MRTEFSSMGININKLSKKKVNFAPLCEINVTPLVDVMLVLLIIFMVTSPMMISGVSVDLPNASTNTVGGDDTPINVTIEANGRISLGEGIFIEHSNLKAKLLAISHEKLDTRIFVRGDKNVSYGQIMSTIAEINKAGFVKVALITDNSKNE